MEEQKTSPEEKPTEEQTAAAADAAAENEATAEEPEAEPSPVEEDAIPVPEEPSEEAPKEDWQEQYLRLAADYENFRKRTLREKAELSKRAKEELLQAMLPAIDDLHRAVDAADKAETMDQLREGLKLVHKKLKNSLKKQQVEELPDIGHPFNSEIHEAITSMPVEDEAQKGKVIDVVEKGYRFHDRVIRYAKVVIGE